MRWTALPLCVLLPSLAFAWTEARPITSEARVVAAADGTASVAYRTVFQVEAGWFRGFTLAGLPEDARMDPTRCRAIDEAGTAYGLQIRQGSRRDRDTFWIDIEGGHGVGRGQLVVELAWSAKVQVHHTDEGVVYEWGTPPWGHGLGMVSATLELPFAADRLEALAEPDDEHAQDQALADTESSPIPSGVTSPDTMSSTQVAAIDPTHAKVTASRFRLPRWSSLRVRALLARQPMTHAARAGHRARPRGARHGLVARYTTPGLCGLALLVIVLGIAKRLATRAIARRAGAVTVDALLPWLGRIPRFVLAAALVTLGAAIQVRAPGWALPGTAAVLAGTLLLARHFDVAVAMRAPGAWVDLDPGALQARRAEARFRQLRLASILDATCLRGLTVLLLALGIAIAASLRLPREQMRLALLLPIDTLAILLPLVLTGTRRHLPPDLGGLSARLLARHGRKATRLLGKNGGGEVSLIGREVRGADGPWLDELRLRLVPRRAPEGLLSVELGVEVWCSTPRLALLVRAAADTPAAGLLRQLRGVSERARAKDGATIVAVITPGPDGHSGLFRDLRHALRLFAKAVPAPAPQASRAAA